MLNVRIRYFEINANDLKYGLRYLSMGPRLRGDDVVCSYTA
jgi:hypothetical protein